MHGPHPPSIDPGVMAFVWALVLALLVYLFLVGVAFSHAFAFMIAALAFAAIWLFIRLRGEDSRRA